MKLFSWRQLPRDAEPIQAEWVIKEGGVRAYAWTDENGAAYLSVKTLNRIGKVTGAPDWVRCRRFAASMVVGFIGDRPLLMKVRARVTRVGLELIVRLPSSIKKVRDFSERHFSPWGSPPPSFSITLVPTQDHYAVKSYPSK